MITIDCFLQIIALKMSFEINFLKNVSMLYTNVIQKNPGFEIHYVKKISPIVVVSKTEL